MDYKGLLGCIYTYVIVTRVISCLMKKLCFSIYSEGASEPFPVSQSC
jgi:hypothetical protein